MKAAEQLPVKCPGCGARISFTNSTSNRRHYICGAVRDRDTQTVIKECPVSKQIPLFQERKNV